jgi:hypothetical protein
VCRDEGDLGWAKPGHDHCVSCGLSTEVVDQRFPDHRFIALPG